VKEAISGGRRGGRLLSYRVVGFVEPLFIWMKKQALIKIEKTFFTTNRSSPVL